MPPLMFRVGVSYFRKSSGRAVNHEEKAQKGSHAVYEDLLKALEQARTRLAVAIAAETKATPLSRWNYYLETAEQIRRCLKQLRTLPRSNLKCGDAWYSALDSLRQLPPRPDSKSRHGEAQQLCQRLRSVLGQLDMSGHVE